ncbi:PEF-CTERM sorting domain-containing protein [Methanolobus sp. ZRKC2]|uniref:PEF-CTERM sorting domain-containing protein n=1 Tax=Methanolobus sp. ZRKC2 TaxID=3125783 RepID=UPI0032560E18
MDRRLIFISLIMFASVLLLSGLMAGTGGQDEPISEGDAGENYVSSSDAPASEPKEIPVEEKPLESTADEPETTPSLGMSGGSSAPTRSSSSSSGPGDEKSDVPDDGNKSVFDDGNKSVFDDGNKSVSDDGNGEQAQEIPEFPTIALPMLAIVGLAFVFRRK